MMNAEAFKYVAMGRRLAIGILLLAAPLAGCVTPGGLRMDAGFPAPDPNDSCDDRVQALKADYDYFQQPLFAPAASQATANFVTAFSGFALKAVAGGGIDASTLAANMFQQYSQVLLAAALSQATKDYLMQVGQDAGGSYTQVSHRIDADANRDAGRLRRVQNGIRSLQKCRDGQIRAIDRDYARKRITAAQARAQYGAIQDYVRRDSQWIQRLTGESSERVYVFNEADRHVAKQTKPTASTTKTKQPNTTGKKAKAGSGSVAQATQEQRKAEAAQAEVVQLDQTIERRKSGLPS